MRAGFEEVLRQMPAAVMIVEAPSGRIIFRNRRAQQWREQSPTQARATKLADAGNFEIYHPDGRSYEMEDWPLIRCIRTGEVVRDEEFVYPLADGSMLLLRCDASPIYDDGGHIVAGVGLFYDITEQKLAEEQLARNTYLEENAHDAFIATDERLVVTAWNRGAEQMYGLTADEALGRDAREVVSLVMSDEQLAEALREVAEEGRLRVEQIQHRKDGTPVHIDSLTIAMRDGRGETTGYLAINRDITERKRAEEEIEAKTHQQAVVAELGLKALAGSDLQSLMDAAVVLVARTLELEYSQVVEILPDGEELLIVAGGGGGGGGGGKTKGNGGFGAPAGGRPLSQKPGG